MLEFTFRGLKVIQRLYSACIASSSTAVVFLGTKCCAEFERKI